MFADISVAHERIIPMQMMPTLLMLDAKERNCQPVYDFYSQPGRRIIKPPYVYGYLEGRNDDDSIVYWCQSSDSGDVEYFLNIIFTDNAKHNGCSTRIRSPYYYPGGLSIIRDVGRTLDEFVYLDPLYDEKLKKHPPKGIALDGPLIHSADDGLGVEFYCYKNSWLVRWFH